MNESPLAEKVAIVTGAGGGVGQATALALAAEGTKVVLVGRGRESLEQTAALVKKAGASSLVAPGDVADEIAVADIVGRTIETFGGIDILINAAAVGLYGKVAEYPLSAWNETIATNLTGVFLFSRAVLASMRNRGAGSIISIGSGAGKQGYADLAAYSASKFGLIGLMQSLAAEVGGDGIKVSTILPGSILTEFAGRSIAEKQALKESGRKYLNPEDVAEAILFLLRQPTHAWTQEMNLWPV